VLIGGARQMRDIFNKFLELKDIQNPFMLLVIQPLTARSVSGCR
jgi:hypothetical protein